MKAELLIKQVDWRTEQTALSALRRTVFIEEQAVPEELEWDDMDAVSSHFLATLNNQPVGTARLTPNGQICRIAVLKNHRHKGIASALLTAVLAEAEKQGFQKVFLHAQADVVQLYENFGFIRQGDIFLEAGIKHQQMYKLLNKTEQ